MTPDQDERLVRALEAIVDRLSELDTTLQNIEYDLEKKVPL